MSLGGLASLARSMAGFGKGEGQRKSSTRGRKLGFFHEVGSRLLW